MLKYSVEKLPLDVRLELAQKPPKTKGAFSARPGRALWRVFRQFKALRNPRTDFFGITFKIGVCIGPAIRF